MPALENEWQVFLAGAGVALVLVCGLTLTFMGAARRVRDRRDLRDLREEHEESLTTLEMEKRRLQRELARVKQSGLRQAPPREPPCRACASRDGPPGTARRSPRPPRSSTAPSSPRR